MAKLMIYDMPAATVMELVKAVAANEGFTLKDAGDFAGYGLSTARKALINAVTLGMVAATASKYACLISSVHRSMPAEHALRTFRHALQSFRPFEAICEGLAAGESLTDAVRKARILLGLEQADDARLQTLVRWGVEVEIIRREPDAGMLLRPELMARGDVVEPLSDEHLDSLMRARLHVAKILGPEANNYLDETDRLLLSEAILNSQTLPEEAVTAAGQALEDFLRQIANDRGLVQEAKMRSGASQLAQMLKDHGLIHAHQQKVCDLVSTVRNAKAHKKDKTTLRPWHITPEASKAVALATLVAVRSVHEYVVKGGQTL